METRVVLLALGALAYDTRLALFRLLVVAGPTGLSAGRLGERLGLPPATASFHLKELRNAGLVSRRREGRRIFYVADYNAMNALMAYLLENCCRGEAECATEAVCCPGTKEKRHESSARSRRRTRSR